MGGFMKKDHLKLSRRSFIKATGAAGVGTVLSPLVGAEKKPSASVAQASEANGVPTRIFGKSAVHVPILSLGGMFDIPSNQTLLKQAIRWGVTYWDTAHIYSHGKSEIGIGKYLSSYPEQRKDLFIVTKSTARSPSGLSKDLATSLKRMNTGYVDLFFVHAINDFSTMDKKIKAWAAEQKAAGKIRLFGFSTHRNMAQCLMGASKHDWIDGIMMTYNYRIMHEKQMKKAVDACVKAGIGLTAMKTQGGGTVETESSRELELAGRFVQKGYTDKQAKLKAVWENPQISAICSQMPTMSILMANIAAAVDRTSLTDNDRFHLERYATETFSCYCAGCAQICENAVPGNIPIGDVMRYLMYEKTYGDTHDARKFFNSISPEIRDRMMVEDFSVAESRCPRKLPIARLMHEAVTTIFS
jgi:predicted aldo/keto reductase-like oxidoreductase